MSADRPIPSPARPLRALVRAGRLARLRALHPSVRYGSQFAVGAGAVWATDQPLVFGDRVHIGRDFLCEAGLVVGDDVLISSRVALIGNDHDFTDPAVTVFAGRRLPTSHVRLAGDNLLGHGVVVVGDVTIGFGAIVGAGSLVTTDLPPGTVCVGRPARPLRARYVGEGLPAASRPSHPTTVPAARRAPEPEEV